MSHNKDAWVSQRAYSLWESEGRPDGRGESHWAQALREFEQLELAALAGTRQRFLIRDAGTLVGWVSVTNVVRGPFRSANLGYAVAQEANGRGIATHAVGEVCDWAFGEAGLHRLEAGTLLDNHGSQRVLAKNGFERIGIARRYLLINGEWRDHILFQRVADG